MFPTNESAKFASPEPKADTFKFFRKFFAKKFGRRFGFRGFRKGGGFTASLVLLSCGIAAHSAHALSLQHHALTQQVPTLSAPIAPIHSLHQHAHLHLALVHPEA